MTQCVFDFFYHYIHSGVTFCLKAGCCGSAPRSGRVVSQWKRLLAQVWSYICILTERLALYQHTGTFQSICLRSCEALWLARKGLEPCYIEQIVITSKWKATVDARLGPVQQSLWVVTKMLYKCTGWGTEELSSRCIFSL